jgi:glycine/D-amino acid oxidase-like deaminating enzyme
MLDLARDPAGGPLKPGMFRTGFEYSDCRVDDARLVMLNARDAAEHGATVCSRNKAIAAARRAGGWDIVVEDCKGRETIHADALVNAAGPWVAQLCSRRSATRPSTAYFHMITRVAERPRSPDGGPLAHSAGSRSAGARHSAGAPLGMISRPIKSAPTDRGRGSRLEQTRFGRPSPPHLPQMDGSFSPGFFPFAP